MFEGIFNRQQKIEDERLNKEYSQQEKLTSMNLTAQDDRAFFENKEQQDLIRWQQDLDDELFKLRCRLKNLERNEAGDWKTKQIPIGYNESGQLVYGNMPPLCNDLCIQMIETQLEPLLSRNIINSNFDEKRILKILRHTADELANNLYANFTIYELASVADYFAIMRICKNAMIAAPYRALNDGERKHQRTINKRIESVSQSNQVQAKRFGIF